MASITTLRPSATSSGVGWSADPSGTLHGVTSDDNDATSALWSGSGSALILATPLDSPPAGERRHLVRLRARGEDGSAWWAVRLASGTLVAGASGTFPSTPGTIVGSWQDGAPPDGSTTLSAYVTGQSTGVKITELFLDVDSREAPTFTAQVLDGSGTPNTTVTDTVAPFIRANALDLDGLPARMYRFWVTLGASIVWDTGEVSGAPVNTQTTPLDNGNYTAHLQVWSTLGDNTAYSSVEETLDFTMSVGVVSPPDPPTIAPELPFYRIMVCAPNVGDFDGYVGYVEIQRVDCLDESTTIAMLGPLATDECAEWVDFTLPRSGVGRTCDHDPEECCSYYRVRTVGRVDGALLVSDWSDAFNPGLPQNLAFMWPGEALAIPSGWSRVTELDGRYPKQVADVLTQPGSVGGADTHTHSTPTHSHNLDHNHATSSLTGASVGSFNSNDWVAGTLAYPASHTHGRPDTEYTNALQSGATSPGSSVESNHPSRLDVLFIEPDGTPTGVPDGALALMGDISPTGWDTYTDATGRFLRGASTGADGGATVDSEVSAHSHTVDEHTHGGTSHAHDSDNTSSRSGTLSFFAGPTSATWVGSHDHPVTVGSSATESLDQGSGGMSDNAGTIIPPYRDVRVRQNVNGVPDLPIGVIGAWRGSIGTIPDNWQVCDGTNGSPDMFGRYPRGATSGIGNSGGDLNAHSHDTVLHDHTTSGHAHTSAVGASGANAANIAATGSVAVSNAAHTHSITDTNSDTPLVSASTSGTLVSTTTEPPFEEVVFVQLTEVPQPPPEPETFCLEWDDDEHLIRTTGPNGPMYVPVIGKFQWDRDRPFTASMGVNGSRFVTSAEPGGRNLSMVAAVESEDDLSALHEVLARPLVLVSPSDASEVWAAPVAESVRVINVGRIRQVTADFIATGPEPPPQLADVGE